MGGDQGLLKGNSECAQKILVVATAENISCQSPKGQYSSLNTHSYCMLISTCSYILYVYVCRDVCSNLDFKLSDKKTITSVYSSCLLNIW